MIDVLVVGAGPSGLFVAAELARHGVRARVVEREPEPHHQARATAIQPGTLEILDRAGLLEAFLDASVHVPCARVFDTDLNVVSELAFAGAGCRWEFQASLPQWRTEQILLERLEQLGVEVQRGVEARSLEAGEDRMLAGLRRSDGTDETVEAQYVIGAGGAHSITRATMAEDLTGQTYPGTALVADVRLRRGLSRDASSLVAAPEGYVLLAPLPDERWITFVGDLREDEVAELSEPISIDKVRTAMKRRIRHEIELEDIAWAALFHMHRRVVSRMAGKRRFLIGDAGHLSSPFGGEGLNSGLHDGHNLAWKLALVLRGHGRPTLLESFGSERLAADRHVLEVSDQLHELAHAAVESVRTGAEAVPFTEDQVAALVRSRSMLDVSYAGSPIVGQYLGAGEDPAQALAAGERYPGRLAPTTAHQLLLFGPADGTALARLRGRWHDLVEVTETDGASGSEGVILVRPDGYIGFRAGTADAGALAALDGHLESYLIAL